MSVDFRLILFSILRCFWRPRWAGLQTAAMIFVMNSTCRQVEFKAKIIAAGVCVQDQAELKEEFTSHWIGAHYPKPLTEALLHQTNKSQICMRAENLWTRLCVAVHWYTWLNILGPIIRYEVIYSLNSTCFCMPNLLCQKQKLHWIIADKPKFVI